MQPTILSINASPRNGRWVKGIDELLSSIQKLNTNEDLMDFLKTEGKLHLDNFIEAVRKDGIPFDQLYKKLKTIAGGTGLCNSEIGNVAGLWGAFQLGSNIDHVALSQYFDSTGKKKNIDELKNKVLRADGLLMATPVYFGDRSSLASDFIEYLRQDPELSKSIVGKPMVGIAAGAKRNGGQETALIYQIVEMMNLGMLGLGNDTETSAQYGGTIVAGDVGMAADDMYGLGTSIGAGRRLARVAKLLKISEKKRLNDQKRVLFWILQDKDDTARKFVDNLVSINSGDVDVTILNLVDYEISRCMGCDICPTHVGTDSEYRCINKRKNDAFVNLHNKFADYDMIVPVAFSPKDRNGIKNVYQRFIERTRYLRRGDFMFSNILIMPLVFEEVGSYENLQTRMLTSLIRHHTVMLKPNVGFVHKGGLLNHQEVCETWRFSLEQAEKLTVGKLQQVSDDGELDYKPVGYILSVANDQEKSVEERRVIMRTDRNNRRLIDARNRLVGTVE
jgi:multimeric flavodoxin WrbA